MKLIKRRSSLYGLQSRFLISMLMSTLLCVFLFYGLYLTMNHFFNIYIEESNLEENYIQKQGESLQSYIKQQNITLDDISEIKKWEKRHPIIILELYMNNECIYSSFFDTISEDGREMLNHTHEGKWLEIQIEDQTVDAFVYADFDYQYYVIGIAVAFGCSLLVFVFLMLFTIRKIIRYVCRLNNEVHILAGGNLEYQVAVEGNDEITDLAISMNRMRVAFQQQMEEVQKLYETNRQLVTEMSHDLRTPLTCILLYLELLRSRQYQMDPEVKKYLERIDAKACHLKLLSDHLFEYSIDAGREKKEKPEEPVSTKQAFQQVLDAFAEDMKERGYRIALDMKWQYKLVQVKQEYLYRIMENIQSNLVKYADASEEIRVAELEDDCYFGLSFSNRLAEGDALVESNGVGIESICSMMAMMKGNCTVEQTDVSYELLLLFPKV